MKIALGTVQFGLDYGVSNAAGRVPAEEVTRILDGAETAGVRVLDTARAYGGAENLLGAMHASERFGIVTKTAPLGAGGVSDVAAHIEESIAALGGSPVYGLLVHSASDLLGDQGAALAALLMRLRSEGTVTRIGVSAYTAEELFAALDVLDADLVQVPVNVFDQRLVTSGALAELKKRQIEVHGRSAFLQGLLLMDPASLPAYFAPIRDRIEQWRAFCDEREVTPLAAALGFVTGLCEVDQVVVGVETAEQLAQVVASAASLPTTDFAPLALNDPAYIDPSRWQVDR